MSLFQVLPQQAVHQSSSLVLLLKNLFTITYFRPFHFYTVFSSKVLDRDPLVHQIIF